MSEALLSITIINVLLISWVEIVLLTKERKQRVEVISRVESNSPASLSEPPPVQLQHVKYSQEGNRVWHLLVENL